MAVFSQVLVYHIDLIAELGECRCSIRERLTFPSAPSGRYAITY
jgi:hypothetical protein